MQLSQLEKAWVKDFALFCTSEMTSRPELKLEKPLRLLFIASSTGIILEYYAKPCHREVVMIPKLLIVFGRLSVGKLGPLARVRRKSRQNFWVFWGVGG